jgi:hypothetical protein
MSEGQQAQKSSVQKEGAYNKSEKTKDVRTTNIQAAKGIFFILNIFKNQLSQIV